MVESIKLEGWQLDALQLVLGQRQQIEAEFGRLRDMLQKNQTTMDGMRAAWGFAVGLNYEHVGDGVFMPKPSALAPDAEPTPIRKEEAV